MIGSSLDASLVLRVLARSVQTKFRLGEIDSVRLEFRRASSDMGSDSVIVTLIAAGEWFECELSADQFGTSMDEEALQRHLDGLISDFVAESRFGWGENR